MKNMKYLFSAFLSFACIIGLHAQQEPLFSQYMSNTYLRNPAIAGSKGNHSLNLFHRWQWVTFPGAPQTFGITYQGLFGKVHGVGGLLFSDITGPSYRIGFKGSYAFHIPLNETMKLSIGAAGRLVRNTINTRVINFQQSNDAAVDNASESVYGGDAEFGLFLYHSNFYVGFSAPNLIQTKIDFGANPANRDPIGKGYRHYFLTGGYKFNVTEKIMLEPSIMVKYVKGPYPQIDGGINVRFLEDQLAFGVFYRNPGFLSFQAKFLFDKSIPLLLSFDVSTARFQNYSVGATEVILGYDFPTRTMDNPSNNKVSSQENK